MSAEPPPSGRPTGPPSGPLQGPSQPSPSRPTPTQPGGRIPTEPPSGGGGGEGGSGGRGPGGPEEPGKGPERHWWNSAPRVALISGAVAAAVILGLVFSNTNSGGGKNAGGEVFLQAAGAAGPDPYTESTANDSSAAPETPTVSTGSAPANVTRGVNGSAPGLYSGTRNVASCNVEKQISSLQADPAKSRAFASVQGIQPSGVPAYLRSLTPVQLRVDTRVTNHGYRNGASTSYQAIFQAGTSVLVDSRGVPRVRCACGNPVAEPVQQKTTPKPTGDSWPAFRPQNVVVVAPSVTVINVFVIFDPHNDEWIARTRGDNVHHDKKTHPPTRLPFPSVSVSSPSPKSPSPKSPSPKSPSPSSTSSSASPSSKSPSPESSSPSSTSKSPSSESSSPSSTSPKPSSPSASESPSKESPSKESPSSEYPSSKAPSPTSTSAPASGSASAERTTASSPAQTESAPEQPSSAPNSGPEQPANSQGPEESSAQ
ncbi:DUF6777 domain-containing protein [Streptomyces albiflavescens]|uniref:DUF6777 domain-containing protein n=1 Tax=Streptomyces albiflavescens TaxID=1623582 RepID=UPI001664C647|nr:DUF6777 domain-containing protein [Streptomyces albiflavescens]